LSTCPGLHLRHQPNLQSVNPLALSDFVSHAAVETGVAAVTAGMLDRLPTPRRKAVLRSVTIDLDTTDIEVYGRKKRGVADNYQGQRCGRPHVASWAELQVTLAADLLAGDQDPRPGAPGLLRRALRALPAGVGEVKLRADCGYVAVDLAVAAHREGVRFAIGAKRIAPLWKALAGLSESDWTDATCMPGAQVAVARYCPPLVADQYWAADPPGRAGA